MPVTSTPERVERARVKVITRLSAAVSPSKMEPPVSVRVGAASSLAMVPRAWPSLMTASPVGLVRVTKKI
jgi:hypothetical protein